MGHGIRVPTFIVGLYGQNFAIGLLGFGFAMVPMYRQICEAIGITQTRSVGSVNTQVDTSRVVKVELLASELDS